MLCCIIAYIKLPLLFLTFLFTPSGFGIVVSTIVGLLLLQRWCRGGRCYSKARLDGKTAIITGANIGIGKETARDFIRRGARVIMACRNVEKAEIAAAEIRTCATNDGEAIVKQLDLASLKSVREFCKDVLENEGEIHLLINNAGVMMCPEWKTEDGFELQIGTNHFGHFLLTNLLLDKIKKSAPARIVNVSSSAHYGGQMNFENINLTGKYNRFVSYFQSKLANVLFNRELAKRLKGTGVSAFVLHPGAVTTNLSQHLVSSWPFLDYVFKPARPILFKTSEEGAQTSIYCAVQEGIENESGKYFSDCKVKAESKLGQVDADAERLWQLSEEMTSMK